MTKKIEWKESSIDYDALNSLSDSKLSWIENGKSLGNLNKELDRIGNKIGSKETRSKGAKNSSEIQKKSGKLEKFRAAGTNAAALNKVNRSTTRKIELLNDITSAPFIIKDIENIFKKHGMPIKTARNFLNETKYFKNLGFDGHKSKVYQKKDL